MVSIGQVPGQTEDSQVTKYQEVDTIHQSLLISVFFNDGKRRFEPSHAAQHIHVSYFEDYNMDIFRSKLYLDVLEYESHIMSFLFFFNYLKGFLDTYIFFLEGNY